ncbi:hypothetical protein [Inquilinus sp.]|uniref:hypothetical protein n=1 Tax=Inquilinus sp. TaxID=1932117 RepID=UPI0031DDE79D
MKVDAFQPARPMSGLEKQRRWPEMAHLGRVGSTPKSEAARGEELDIMTQRAAGPRFRAPAGRRPGWVKPEAEGVEVVVVDGVSRPLGGEFAERAQLGHAGVDMADVLCRQGHEAAQSHVGQTVLAQGEGEPALALGLRGQQGLPRADDRAPARDADADGAVR